MACTVAVEEVIDEHYGAQLADIDEGDGELKQAVEDFRREEVEHRDTGLALGARQAPAYEALSAAIKVGSRLAIWLSERL
jgi:ubiquinone biosynthesis monooxygenase Coq7